MRPSLDGSRKLDDIAGVGVLGRSPHNGVERGSASGKLFLELGLVGLRRRERHCWLACIQPPRIRQIDDTLSRDHQFISTEALQDLHNAVKVFASLRHIQVRS